MTASVEGRMARGAIWMVLFKLIERSLGFISTLILVRLLAPADFGLIAMAMSFIAMAELLAAFGFDIALIQNQRATEDLYHTAWTCNLLLGALIALIMLATAQPIADFYNHPELFWVVCALAAGPAISGLENIGIVAFRRDLDFRREFAFQLSRKIIGFLVVVPLAFVLHSYWALVAGTLTSRLAGTLISYLAHPFRPHLSISGASRLFRFSKWLLLNNLVGFLKERSSDFVIGRFHGAAALGVYNVSYEFASLPTTELSAPINRALLPGFAKMVSDRSALQIAYTNALGLLALVAVPAAAGIFAVAPFLVPVVLGQRWLDSVPLMQILSINGALLLFHSSICSLLIASGNPSRVMVTNGLFVVILLSLLAVLATRTGVVGAAYAALSASVLTTPVYLYQLKRCLGVPAPVFLRAAAFPVTAALGMVLTIDAVTPDYAVVMPMRDAIMWLLYGVIGGIAVYIGLVGLLWMARGRPAGPERIVLDYIKTAATRFRPAHTPI
jgi:lipopolysaccharide exporter